MSEDQQKAAKVIEAASKAIDRIVDPTKRVTAQAKLEQMQRTAAKAATQPSPITTKLNRDFER